MGFVCRENGRAGCVGEQDGSSRRMGWAGLTILRQVHRETAWRPSAYTAIALGALVDVWYATTRGLSRASRYVRGAGWLGEHGCVAEPDGWVSLVNV